MSTQDFLRQEYEQAQKASGGFITIAKCTVLPGWRCGILPDVTYVTYVTNNEKLEAESMAKSKHTELGGQYSPAHGILLTINGSDIPTHPEGKFSWGDWKQFLEFKPRLKADEQAEMGNNTLPTVLFMNALDEFSGLEIGKEQWMKLQQQIDNHREVLATLGRAKPRDVDDKNKRHNFYLIRGVYPSESAAKEDAASLNEQSSPVAALPFSDKAKANYPDLTQLQASADEIHQWLEKASKDIAFGEDAKTYPLPKPNTLPARKKYIADIYSVEASDIDLLRVEVSF
jgi:hypothetical protein